MDWRPFPLDVLEQGIDTNDGSVAHLAVTHSVIGSQLACATFEMCDLLYRQKMQWILHTRHVRLLCEGSQAMYSALATCQPPPNSLLHLFKALCLGFGSQLTLAWHGALLTACACHQKRLFCQVSL